MPRKIADMDAADYLGWKVRESMLLGDEPPSEKELSEFFRTVILDRPLSRPSGSAREAAPTLGWLQENLPWTIPYSAEFEASAEQNPSRRIVHDVLHVMKSLGRIAAACESADHAREPKPIEWNKEVADLVICALHIAKLRGFSLEDAVVDCSSTRNGVDLRKHFSGQAGGEGDGHASDCATHNEPAYPNGPCNCRRGPLPPLDEVMETFPKLPKVSPHPASQPTRGKE